MGSEWRTAPRVCRCCLSEGCYKDISAEYYWMGEKEMYSEMLRECFDLTITLQESSSSSRLICEVCITRLRDAANFKKQVITSEKRFAEHLRTGTSLAAITVNERPPSVQEIKLETVKTEAVISDDDDDDPADPVDDYDDDPDYDESDSLPLKFEALKKETMVDISFGDEIPVLNNPEMTIKRVSSKTKEKSPSKKIKLSKKELTIKPVKASGSKTKVKAPKEPKVKAPKAAKTSKKGNPLSGSSETIEPSTAPFDSTETKKMLKMDRDMDKTDAVRASVVIFLESSHVCPFKWQRNKYGCFYCDAFFGDPHLLRDHNATLHETPDVAKAVKQIKKNHLAKVDVTVVDCKLCNEPIQDFKSLKLHLVQAHSRKFPTNCTDGVLPFKLTLEVLKCELCEESFTEFKTLNQHMNTHYRNFICDTCGAGFITPERLKTHGLSHQTDSVPCDLCDKVFRSLFGKNEHVANVHRQVKRHRCPHCSEAFRNYFQRNKHITLVHKIKCKEHACSMCPKIFTSSGKLSHHVKTVHLKEKRHTCDICNWKVFSKSELNDHMIKHSGERIHQCSVCKKSYARKYTLREHMRIHNNDRRFSCAVCGKSFVQKCSLTHHLKVHHPDSVHYRTAQDGVQETAQNTPHIQDAGQTNLLRIFIAPD